MNNSASQNNKLVLLDFASEKNRGDAAMQVSMIELSQKYFPGASLSVVTVFGTNQCPECLEQFDHTYPKYKDSVSYVGGLLTTHDAISNKRNISNKYLEKIQRVFHLVGVYFFILLIFTRIPTPVWSWALSNEKQSTLITLQEADYIIWNGRNFRGYTILGEILQMLRLLVHPLFCIGLQKPMVCLGASVWDLRSSLSRALLLFVFSRCQLVTLRENFSYNYIQRLMANRKFSTRYMQVPDLSLYMLSQMHVPRVIPDGLISVTITLVGEREVGDRDLYRAYIEAQKQLVEYLQKTYNARFIVVPQVIFEAESNTSAIEQVFSGVSKESYHIINKPLTVAELVAVYRDSQMLIASRMHSAIFALTQGVPVLAIAYDEGAKWNILADMGLSREAVIHMSELPQVDLPQVFEKIHKQKETVVDRVQQTLCTQLYPATENQFVQAKSLMEEFYDK